LEPATTRCFRRTGRSRSAPTSTTTPSSQSDYWTVRPDGKDLTQLTHNEQGRLVLSTSYSPDGKWIVHATNGVEGNADIFVMRADGTGNMPVTHSKLWDSAPDWGPEGS
jgi:TolB protein